MSRESEFYLTTLPDDPREAIAMMNQHIVKLNAVVLQLLAYQLPVRHSAPLKPRQGVIAYADGTDWDPGSGEGVYEFKSDLAWHKL